MIESLLNSDIETFLYLHNLGVEQWDAFWLFVTNKYSSIPLYVLLLFFTYKHYGFKNTLFVLLAVVVLITMSDQSSNFCKYYFQRLRPCHDENVYPFMRLGTAHCGGLYSYFSAHASNAMVVAVFFGLLFKKKSTYVFPFLLFWAFLVSYSRIYIGVHYPLDVLTGIIVGTMYAVIVFSITKRILK